MMNCFQASVIKLLFTTISPPTVYYIGALNDASLSTVQCSSKRRFVSKMNLRHRLQCNFVFKHRDIKKCDSLCKVTSVVASRPTYLITLTARDKIKTNSFN